MATIKQWLEDYGFDFDKGRIIYQETDYPYPGWCDPDRAMYIPTDHPILTTEFDNGYGGPNCPRFIAEDTEAIYFPVQYDGATWLEKVWKNLDKYLSHSTPYPGG